MHYYGTRLSENISRREPEGYLLCLNVPVARTGVQEYLPGELGMPAGPALIPVYRPEEEVFSPATVASFEGMPVTNNHPPEGVDVFNIRALQKGHAHNVRRGSGEESDLLLADLIITDPALIRAVLEDGKREISCGYTYELSEENGQYVQRQIRGNHVAVVDAGRAGSRVSIKDEQPPGSPVWKTAAMLQPPGLQPGMRQSHHQPERRKINMKKSLSKVLARMAKDGDVETVAEIIGEMIEPEETPASAQEHPAPEAPGAEPGTAEEEPAAVIETPEATVIVDEAVLGEVISRLDRIISLLAPQPAADDDPAERIAEAVEEVIEAAEAADPMTEEVAAAMEEILNPVSTVIPDAEEEEQEIPETLQAGDALRAALAAVKPVLARMPRNQRQKTARDIAARLRHTGRRGTTGADAYAAMASACRRTAPASAELGRRIMEKRNASYRR